MPLPSSERLMFSEITEADAAFILKLTNSDGWLRFIGDRGVRTEQDAGAFIDNGPRAMYARYGHGIWRLQKRDDPRPIGVCGLIRREELPAPDLGFALLPEFTGLGYAGEAASACIDFARRQLRWPELLAIVQVDNAGSLKLLRSLGFQEQPSPHGSEPLLRLALRLR
jgi:[ribosomal protein S5]-alanine N-acetyltransferase